MEMVGEHVFNSYVRKLEEVQEDILEVTSVLRDVRSTANSEA